MNHTIRIIRPSSREQQDLLAPRIQELEGYGFDILYDDITPDKAWSYSAGSISDRKDALMMALTESESQIVVAARGGYGASDFLEELDFDRLKRSGQKILVGFSDISALHSALYSKLGWAGLHAPMPATSLWTSESPDIKLWRDAVKTICSATQTKGSFGLSAVGESTDSTIDGILFGGCFSVLTNLIGTPYFPESLEGHILFFEDTDENPARLLRYFNQWKQSGALSGVRAIVIGCLQNLGQNIEDSALYTYEQFAARCDIPVYRSLDFGHVAPNSPILIGSKATISSNTLSWQMNFAEGAV